MAERLKPGDPRRHNMSGFHRLNGEFRRCEAPKNGACTMRAVWWVWDYRYDNGTALCTGHFRAILYPGRNAVRDLLDQCPPDTPLQ
jgi:hypothetical protein